MMEGKCSDEGFKGDNGKKEEERGKGKKMAVV